MRILAAIRRGIAAMRAPEQPRIFVEQPMEAAVVKSEEGDGWRVVLLNPWLERSTRINFDELPVALLFVNEIQRVGGVEYQFHGIPEAKS